MKRVLFFAPSFFSYEKIILNELSKYYQVTYIVEKYYEDYYKIYKRSIISRLLSKVSKKYREKNKKYTESFFVEKYCNLINFDKNFYSLIFCIKGDYIPDDVFKKIKDNNPSAKFIIYEWDDIKLLNKTSHFKFFEKRLSYNLLDCRELNFDYLPMFVSKSNYSKIKKYDILFVGTAHTNRKKFVKLLDKNHRNYKKFIYLYSPEKNNEKYVHNEKISYENYLKLVAQSRVVVDLARENQTGPTTRFDEAIFLSTKVATVNRNVENYPFFKEENVCFINEKNPIIPTRFIDSPFVEYTDYSPLLIDEWIKKIIEDN